MKHAQSRRRLRLDIVAVVTIAYTLFFYFVVNMEAFLGKGPAEEATAILDAIKDQSIRAKATIFDHTRINGADGDDSSTAETNLKRQQAIVQMTRSAWRAYMAAAKGHDELMPVSNSSNDRWGGIGVTAVDAMDTLLLMGLDKEFNEAAKLSLEVDLSRSTKELSVFETIIRHLGAALSVHTATNDLEFLRLAKTVIDGLLHAFDTPLGFPMHTTMFGGRVEDAKPWYTGNVLLAECGSNQLEMRYLSHLTRNETYADVTNTFTQFLLDRRREGWPLNASHIEPDSPPMPHKGLWGTFLNPSSGKFSGAAGFHSLMDSTYEYLLKQWILFGKDDDEMLMLYEDAVEGFLKHLLRYMPNTNYAVIGYHGLGYFPVMDHLVCFTPGMLILGVMHGAHSWRGRMRDWESEDVVTAAVDLLATCYRLYAESPIHIGPEIVEFEKNGKYTVRDPKYILRPETIESIFYMYRYTHDEKYRDWGWKIALAINEACRTPNGAFSSLFRTDAAGGRGGEQLKMDKMESFFFAETLKYLYLLFSDDEVMKLDKFVLTTEAHPLPILPSRPWNKRRQVDRHAP